MMAFAEGYIDVATRILEFREKHADGSLQPADMSKPFEVREIGGQTFIIVVAAAYRSQDDQRPGIGMAYEPFPGKTPYTRGSELQNAETSAWGRAIVAALVADTRKGIASADEVRNRPAERETPAEEAPPKEAPPKERTAVEIAKARLWQVAKALGWSLEELSTDYSAQNDGMYLSAASVESLDAYAAKLEEIKSAREAS